MNTQVQVLILICATVLLSSCRGSVHTSGDKMASVRIAGGKANSSGSSGSSGSASNGAADAGSRITGERFSLDEDELVSKESVRAWRIALAHSEREKMSEAEWKAAQVNDEAESMRILSQLSKDHPKASYVKTMMAQVKQHFGKKDEAADYYEQAMLENRRDPILLLKLANAKRGAAKHDRAIKYYREIVAIDPSQVDPKLVLDAKLGLACSLVAQGKKTVEARELLEAVLEQEPENTEALLALKIMDGEDLNPHKLKNVELK